jgi:uncharacterized protein (TIRG00374 family)
MRSSLKWLKYLIPLIILPWLYFQVDPKQLEQLQQQPKNWWLLGVATAACALAMIISFLRWQAIARAVGIPLDSSEAVKLGFVGQIFGMISPGSVGGDVFKAIAIARQHKHSGPAAVASVLVDRAVGLYGLILLSTISLVLFGDGNMTVLLKGIRNTGVVLTIVGAVGLLIAVVGGKWLDWIEHLLQRFPYIGHTLRRLVKSLRVFENRPTLVVIVLLMSFMVHLMLMCSLFMISSSLYATPPSFVAHLQVVPSAMVVGALPIAPAGLGVQELALVEMFKQLPGIDPAFSGLAIAAAYRIATILVSLIGVVYYLKSKPEIAEEDRARLQEEAT